LSLLPNTGFLRHGAKRHRRCSLCARRLLC